MRSPPILLRPRHLAASFLVALLLGGGLLGATASDPEIEPVEPPLMVASVAGGDRGRYEARVEPSPEPLSSRYPEYTPSGPDVYSFETGPLEMRYNASGVASVVHRLTVQYDQDGPRKDTQLLYVGQPRSMAIEIRSNSTEQQPGAGWPAPLPGSNTTLEVDQLFTQFTDWESPVRMCGILAGFQGQELPLDGEAFVADHPCVHAAPQDPVRFRALGVRTVDGAREALFEAQVEGSDLWQVRLLLREGVAYPLRIEQPTGNQELFVWRLTHFERGDDELRIGTPGHVLPPLETAPRPQWTLPEGEIEHGFPLSEAFGRARDEPETGLDDFLEQHPEAYVAWARHAQFVMQDSPLLTKETSDRWDFMVTDGEHELGIQVLRREADNGLAIPGGNRTTWSFSEASGPPFDVPYLAPSELPDRLPTVEALWARWEAHASDTYLQRGANSWEFLIGDDPDGPGGTPGLWLSAGHLRYEREPTATSPLTLNDTWYGSKLGWYDGWDRVARQDEGHSRYRMNQASVTEGPAPMAPAEDSELRPLTVSTDQIGGLSTAQAAGITAAALVGGLLYWLWPVLKTAPVGLFSRIHRHRVLDNPQRREVMDAVDAEPGIHFQGLVRATGLPNGTVQHHLHKLVEAGQATAAKGGGYTCYFPSTRAHRQAMAAASALKSSGARKVLLALRESPDASPAHVAKLAGLSAPTVHHHLHRLEAAGLVWSRREGRSIRLKVTEAGWDVGIHHLKATRVVQRP